MQIGGPFKNEYWECEFNKIRNYLNSFSVPPLALRGRSPVSLSWPPAPLFCPLLGLPVPPALSSSIASRPSRRVSPSPLPGFFPLHPCCLGEALSGDWCARVVDYLKEPLNYSIHAKFGLQFSTYGVINYFRTKLSFLLRKLILLYIFRIRRSRSINKNLTSIDSENDSGQI